ncbi:MAG: GNAT family N-acetyltransferase [Proteobacteria bacterium]|nr:GNAT family N-acetyltransferase [Pseudomonadota bacterium]
MTITIRDLTTDGADDLQAFRAHFERHRLESGNSDIHFMPFDPAGSDRPGGLDELTLAYPLHEPRWQRWFVAVDAQQVVGHVNLRGDGLRVGLHRAELGIGIERAWRGRGLGRRLMQTALDFALRSAVIDWVDLKVFAHNQTAIALYLDMGFVQVGYRKDRFRIAGVRIDDVEMEYPVGGA